MKINLITAVSLDGVIGNDDKLLWHISEDLKRYKERTIGNIVIIGRKTYDSLPGVALKNRTYVILHKDDGTILDAIEGTDIWIQHSVDGALKKAKELAGEDKDIYIAGGSMIYDQMIDLCDNVYLTWVNKEYPESNKKFPIDKLFSKFSIYEDTDWIKSEDSPSYKFTIYKKD